MPEPRELRNLFQETPPFPQKINKTKEGHMFGELMFMKEEELKEEGGLRMPPPKPSDAIWLKKYEMMGMTSDTTKKIPFL